MEREESAWLSARAPRGSSKSPALPLISGLDKISRREASFEFAGVFGTDFKFIDGNRIEAAALLEAPGGSSKYSLHAPDDNDGSGLMFPLSHARALHGQINVQCFAQSFNI